jgi:hypothetical protein
MNNKQENKLSMGEATLEVLDMHGALVGAVPAVVSVKTALVNKTLEIRSANMIQLTTTKGKTTSKAQRKAGLADAGYGIAASVQAYASVTGDSDLYMEVNFGRGEILKMEDEQIQQACTIILNAGLAHVANLGDYGVTAVKLTNFETLIANWHVESQLPRVAIAARKVATKAIPVLLRQMDVILKDQLDKLMVLFKDSEPTFYNTYVEARKVVDSGHGAKGPRLSGTVTGHNGALLLDALVRATYLDKVVEARTDAYGAFSMRLPGVVANTEVTVTSSKLGYVTDVRVQTMQPKVNVALTIGLVVQVVVIGGHVNDAITLAGLAGATVTWVLGTESVQTVTDAAGNYSVAVSGVVAQVTGTMTVSRPMYIGASRQVTLQPGVDRNEDFGLNPLPMPPTP